MSTSLLYHAYGLKGVKYNSTEYKKGTVIFHGEVTSAVECCPVCGSWNTVRRKGSKQRVFRMVPIGSRQVLLVLKIWRIRCDECGSLRWPRLPFVRGKRRYTRGFARFAIDLLHWVTISGVAKVLSVGWDLVKDLHKEYLERKYKVPPLKNLKYLGIDEFSIRKGHSYMSIFVDLETGRVLHAVEGRSGKDIEAFLKALKRKAPKLKAIAMDMSTSFISAVEQHLPFIPVVFDRYHVMALMNKAIDELRREQQAQLDDQGRQLLKGSRFLLLKNYEKLDQNRKNRLHQLLALNTPLFTMHTMPVCLQVERNSSESSGKKILSKKPSHSWTHGVQMPKTQVSNSLKGLLLPLCIIAMGC